MSSLMDWNPEWNTGVARIDDQHHELFIISNQLLELMSIGAGKHEAEAALAHVIEYADYHFREEEHLMRDTNFPGYEEHKAAHNEMRVLIAKIAKRFAADERSLPANLMEYLSDWLKTHINGFDKEMAAHVRRQAAS